MASLFKKISPAAARLHTLFHRHARALEFAAGGRVWRLSVPFAAPVSNGVSLYAKLGDGEFTLWLADPDWRLAAASVLEMPSDQLDELPEAVVRAALECYAADLLAAVEKATGLPTALTRLERENSRPPAAACPFELRRDDGLKLAGAWVAAERPGEWRGRLEKALEKRIPPPGAIPEDLPLTAVVTLGGWRMPAALLRKLGPGAVAVSPVGPERVVCLGRTFRFAARLEKGVLAVDGKSMTRPEATAADKTPQGSPDALAGVEEVEIELQAQVGKITLTLAQLRRLGAGQVVEFSTPVESPAVLLAGGRPVARGELVDVGGRVGVRITEMAD